MTKRGEDMTDKELRRLTRAELLEILLSQGKEIERLERELQIAQSKLQDKELLMSKSGSIAEASLRLNGVFEAAQRAAEQYLTNIKLHYHR